MRYVVYLDVFFTINMIMDFLVLIIARHFIKPQTTINRCILGAMAGAVLSAVAFVIPYRALWLRFITSYLVICYIMCIITFNLRGFRKNIKALIYVYIVTFIMGGAMNALYYNTKIGSFIFDIKFTRFISIVLATYLIADLLVKVINRDKEIKKNIVNLKIFVQDKEVMLSALVDTGNSLKAPISGRIVHIVEMDVIKDIIDEEYIKNGKYKVIPFNSVGRSHGLLPAVEVESIEITDGKDISVKMEKQIIAIYDKNLSTNGEYRGLLHESIAGMLEK